MKLTDKQFDVCAWIGRYLLPALSVLIGTIGKIWGLGTMYTEQIPLTITAIDVFWNVVLGIQSKAYFEDKEIVPASVVDENVAKG